MASNPREVVRKKRRKRKEKCPNEKWDEGSNGELWGWAAWLRIIYLPFLFVALEVTLPLLA
jgi:hypothetical protein